MPEKNINGVWVEVDWNDNPIVKSPAAVADPPAAAVPAAAPIAPAAVIKSASVVRDLYCRSVFNAWSAYDAEVRQIYQSYSDAFELGRVQKNDATFNWKNISLVKAWEKRDAILKDLWIKYQACEPGQSELKAVIVRAVHVSPSVYTPQTDAGSYLVKKITTRKSHDCYLEIEAFIKTAGLYTLKVHDGFLVLIADDDELQSKLFTTSPLDSVRV
jgi:hypothetical protein